MPPSTRDLRDQRDQDAIVREHRLEPVEEPAPVCPRCGGALNITRAPSFYPRTIEQCEHVVHCGHWRTLKTVVRPDRPSELARARGAA